MANAFVALSKAHKEFGDLTPRTQDYLRRLEASLQPDAVPLTMGMTHGGESKYVSARFADDAFGGKPIELLQITDVQFGHRACQVKRVIEYRDWILAAPNRFMLWTGDMVDAAHAFSPGQNWDNILTPQGQVYSFCELWAPARHRILAYVGGNHERRTLPMFGDLGMLIATLLRIPYSRGQQFLDVYYGEHKPFKVNMWHGGGAAKTLGATTNMMHYFASEASSNDAQLYLVGHLHKMMLHSHTRLRRDARRMRIVEEKAFVGMSSSFLEYWGTYAETMGLKANSLLMLRAVLELDGHWEVTIR
jgi:hypothetical protein